MGNPLNRIIAAIFVVAAAFVPKFQSRSVTASGSGDSLYLGILDDAREDLEGEKTGLIERRVVMPAFEKREAGWQAVTHFWQQGVKWTVAFDGKNLGQVESKASSVEADQISSDSSRAKQVIVTASADVPTVGRPSREFTGVSSLFGLAAVRRPLVVISKPYYHDPDGWKRTQLQQGIARLVRDAFRRKYPHVDRCKDEEIAEHDWKFPDSALSLPIAYASNKNSFLVAVNLDAGNCG
jgi:hypothetical protein